MFVLYNFYILKERIVIVNKFLSNVTFSTKQLFNDFKLIIPSIIIIAIYYFVTEYIFHEFCPIRIITGYPCPGCGTTRSIIMILNFKLYDALQMNPSTYLWIFYAIYLIWQRYIIRHWSRYNQIIIIIICIFSIVWYAIEISHSFPNREPFTYYHDNLIYRLNTLK